MAWDPPMATWIQWWMEGAIWSWGYSYALYLPSNGSQGATVLRVSQPSNSSVAHIKAPLRCPLPRLCVEFLCVLFKFQLLWISTCLVNIELLIQTTLCWFNPHACYCHTRVSCFIQHLLLVKFASSHFPWLKPHTSWFNRMIFLITSTFFID